MVSLGLFTTGGALYGVLFNDVWGLDVGLTVFGDGGGGGGELAVGCI